MSAILCDSLKAAWEILATSTAAGPTAWWDKRARAVLDMSCQPLPYRVEDAFRPAWVGSWRTAA